MVPINVTDERLEVLASVFGCQKGSLPFTYVGLPLGTTKPKIDDFLALIQRFWHVRKICPIYFFKIAQHPIP
jgi:hypothetical protein